MKNTKTTCLVLHNDIYHKLNIIATVKRANVDETSSMSKIVNDALIEYFNNHHQEIEKTMDEYHKNGGCFEL